jgi:hypothetical protein
VHALLLAAGHHRANEVDIVGVVGGPQVGGLHIDPQHADLKERTKSTNNSTNGMKTKSIDIRRYDRKAPINLHRKKEDESQHSQHTVAP